MNYCKRNILGWLTGFTTVFFALPARALNTGLDATANAAGMTSFASSPEAIIGNIVQQIIVFSGLLLTILFVWAGIEWATAGGEAKKVADAKARMRNAAIGMVIVVGSFAIATTIISALGSATGAEE